METEHNGQVAAPASCQPQAVAATHPSHKVCVRYALSQLTQQSSKPSTSKNKRNAGRNSGGRGKADFGAAAGPSHLAKKMGTNTQAVNGNDIDQVDSVEFELRKRMPPHFSRRRNDIYVTRRTQAKAQLARCEKMFDKAGYSELTIHGFGQAINRALNLGLTLKRRGLGSVDLDINTSTVQVTDDLVPLLDDARPGTKQRFISAVHIRVFHPTVPVTEY